MSKICKQCCQELDLSEFQKDKSSKDGFSRNCRKCKSKLLSEWRSSHPESVKNSQNKDNIKRKYLINEASSFFVNHIILVKAHGIRLTIGQKSRF